MDQSPKPPKIKSPKTLEEVEEALAAIPGKRDEELLSIYRAALPPLLQELEEKTCRVIGRKAILIQDLLERLKRSGVRVRPNAVRDVLREMG